MRSRYLCTIVCCLCASAGCGGPGSPGAAAERCHGHRDPRRRRGWREMATGLAGAGQRRWDRRHARRRFAVRAGAVQPRSQARCGRKSVRLSREHPRERRARHRRTGPHPGRREDLHRPRPDVHHVRLQRTDRGGHPRAGTQGPGGELPGQAARAPQRSRGRQEGRRVLHGRRRLLRQSGWSGDKPWRRYPIERDHAQPG